MRLRQVLIDIDGALGRRLCARERFTGSNEREGAHHNAAVRQAGICQRVRGIWIDRLLKAHDRLPERVTRSPVPQVSSPEIELIRLAIPSGAAREPCLFGAVQCDAQSVHDFVSNLLLDGGRVGERAAVFLSPQLRIGRRVDQFGLNIQHVAALQHSSGQEDAHIQLARRVLRIDFHALYRKAVLRGTTRSFGISER